MSSNPTFNLKVVCRLEIPKINKRLVNKNRISLNLFRLTFTTF